MALTPDSFAEDLRFLIRDKHQGDADAVTEEDYRRLKSGEPLAYIIGWQPFLGLRINLDTHPLIPRPETEWWTAKLITEAKARFGDTPFSVLDLCAGSGAIGLAIAKHLPHAHVTLLEIDERHASLMRENAALNDIAPSRIDVVAGNLYEPLGAQRFDFIATNPPYIPSHRVLPPSVSAFEPHQALFAGGDGLSFIREIAEKTPHHLTEGGRLWLEADISNIEEAAQLLRDSGAHAEILNDQYERPRVVVAYW